LLRGDISFGYLKQFFLVIFFINISFFHIPNIIDLSGHTNKLWSGQAPLRRSRRSRSGRRSGSGSRSRRRSGRKKIILKQYVSLLNKSMQN
jgi:hypothetical protein